MKSIEETVGVVASTGKIPLTENDLEYEIYKEDNNRVITIPLVEHIAEHEISDFVNNLANKLFEKGFANFDIELSLNEAERLTTFEPWRAELEAAGYTITASGTNIKTSDGGTVAGINDNGNLWSGSETVTRIVRGNGGRTEEPQSPQQSQQPSQGIEGTDALRQFAQSDERGIANNPEQREAIRQLQQRLIDLGYDLGSMGADGIYGRRTIAAVRAYQEANNLTADGDAGPETINHLLRNRSQSAADAAIDRRMDGDAAATAQQPRPAEEQPRYFVAILRGDNGESYVVMDRTNDQPVQDERGNNRTFPNRDEAEELAAELNSGTSATPGGEQTPAPGGEQTPTEEPPARPGAFRVRGDLIVGRDSITLQDGRTINKQWELRISDRRLRFVRSTNEYRNAYVGRVNGEERVFVYALDRNRYVALQTGYTNLIEAMRENVPDFDQRVDAEETGPSGDSQTPTNATQEPYTRDGDTVTGTDTITLSGRESTWNWTIAIAERTVTVSLRNRRLVMYDVYINSDGNVAGTKIVNNRSVNTMLQNWTNLSRAFLEYVRDPRVRPENTTNARIGTTQAAASDNPQAVAGAERIEQGRRDNDPDAIAAGVEAIVAAQGNIATQAQRAERAQEIVGMLTATELQNPRVRAALASQQLAIDMNDARNENDREQALRRYVRSIYQTVIPERFRDNATTQQRFEAIVRRAQDEGMMSAFVNPTRATEIIQDEVNRLSGEGATTPTPAQPDQTEQSLEQRWTEIRNSGSPQEITAFLGDLSAEEKRSLGIDPLASTARDVGLGRTGDGGLSVAREARIITTEIHSNLGNPNNGAFTDEEAIQAALQRITDQDMWNTVTGVYAQRYPRVRRNLRTGQLLGDLRGALSRRDWRIYVAPELERLGIEEEYDVPRETNTRR